MQLLLRYKISFKDLVSVRSRNYLLQRRPKARETFRKLANGEPAHSQLRHLHHLSLRLPITSVNIVLFMFVPMKLLYSQAFGNISSHSERTSLSWIILKFQERPFPAVRDCLLNKSVAIIRHPVMQPEVTQTMNLCQFHHVFLVSVYRTWQGTSYRIYLKNKSPSSDYVNSLWSEPDFKMKTLRCLSQFKWNTERRGTGGGAILDLWAFRRL